VATRKDLEAQAVKAGVSKEDAEGAKNIDELQKLIDAQSGDTQSGDRDALGNAITPGTENAPSAGDNVVDNPDIVAGGGSQTGVGTQQAPGVPTTPATIIPPGPTEAELGGRKGGRIERMTMLAWWCPNCGHSNERSLNACGKCGAKVSGDGKSVGAPQRS
jgi:hypothetical protein